MYFDRRLSCGGRNVQIVSKTSWNLQASKAAETSASCFCRIASSSLLQLGAASTRSELALDIVSTNLFESCRAAALGFF